MKRRNFIKLGALGTILYSTNLVSCSSNERKKGRDILVTGATPAGIMAAIAAARLGSSVTLVEYHGHIGGMSTSGLGKSDIENKDAIAGLFKEFTRNIRAHYVGKYGEQHENVAKCKDGYYYEPHVAEKIFGDMIAAEKNITVLVNHQVESVTVEDDSIVEAVFLHRENGSRVTLDASLFIDATYEGDLFALAGAAFMWGREGRSDFNETHAGQIFFDYDTKEILEGSTGEADKKLPAYTYRLCLTDDPENSFVLKEPPPDYNRDHYTGYFADLKEGRLSGPKVFREGHGYYAAHFDTLVRAFSFAEIPNRKYDVNINPRPLGFPFPEENKGYVEAGWEEREQFFRKHRNLTLGLLYFVQNDPEVPEAHRQIANQYHLPKDEFTDNQHFPWQLYVREARRLKGKYILNQNDVLMKEQGRNTVFNDSIIAGEFPIDSFPVSKTPAPNRKVLEGYIGLLPISPYQIPYRILVPEKIKALLVPVAASTTHVAFSTVRMEPLWMGLGQVAGTAAWLALQEKTSPSQISVDHLQKKLLEYNQILTYFQDLPINDKAFKAVQFLGTRGFFDSYEAAVQQPLTEDTWVSWNRLFGKMIGKDVPASGSPSIASFRAALSEVLNPSLKSTIDSNDHLLVNRPDQDPIRRGEACIIYYEVYFKSLDSRS